MTRSEYDGWMKMKMKMIKVGDDDDGTLISLEYDGWNCIVLNCIEL